MTPERFKMEANFEGLIQLLARHLYPEPDVFIRELIQNAHDAIKRRHELQNELAGQIQVQYDLDSRTITIRDNGLGMDREDIRHFLSVIGSTGTGAARREFEARGVQAAAELIGQFGIGLLSAFVVADKIVVRTKKLGSDIALAWHNTGTAECELYHDDLPNAGSEITVFVAPEYAFLLDEQRLREVIVRYCDFIPFPITLNGRGPVNTIDAPWHRYDWASPAEKEAAYLGFLNHRYPDVPLDVIPIEIEAPHRARGSLYISGSSPFRVGHFGMIPPCGRVGESLEV